MLKKIMYVCLFDCGIALQCFDTVGWVTGRASYGDHALPGVISKNRLVKQKRK